MEENNKTRYLIRLRAWDRDSGDLYNWDCFEDYPLKGKNATVPQEYTGFCDKNLKDIYIGDIVNYCGENFLVKFLHGSYILYKLEHVSTLKFHWFYKLINYQNDMEVVGNTFEHAEYLTNCLNSNMIQT